MVNSIKAIYLYIKLIKMSKKREALQKIVNLTKFYFKGTDTSNFGCQYEVNRIATEALQSESRMYSEEELAELFHNSFVFYLVRLDSFKSFLNLL